MEASIRYVQIHILKRSQVSTEKCPLNETVESYLVQFQENHRDKLGSKGVESGSTDYFLRNME